MCVCSTFFVKSKSCILILTSLNISHFHCHGNCCFSFRNISNSNHNSPPLSGFSISLDYLPQKNSSKLSVIQL